MYLLPFFCSNGKCDIAGNILPKIQHLLTSRSRNQLRGKPLMLRDRDIVGYGRYDITGSYLCHSRIRRDTICVHHLAVLIVREADCAVV